jgi:hypothetical protein
MPIQKYRPDRNRWRLACGPCGNLLSGSNRGVTTYKLPSSIAVAAALLATSMGANASDLLARAAAPPVRMVYTPPPFTWTGFYIGGNFGGAWACATLTDNLTSSGVTGNLGGWLGGRQLGFKDSVSRNVRLGSRIRPERVSRLHLCNIGVREDAGAGSGGEIENVSHPLHPLARFSAPKSP